MPRRSRSQNRPARPRRQDRPRKQRPRWRETLDSWGGASVVGTITGAVILTGWLLLQQPLGFAQSDADLLGEEYGDVTAQHVPEGSLTETPSRPPAGGPHYPRPSPTGIFDEPVADGYLIHSLEHGIVWLSYQPDHVTRGQLDGLRGVAEDYSDDVILAPRPANEAALYAVSWGRRLEVDPSDFALLREFIETNRNRSPEPGVR